MRNAEGNAGQPEFTLRQHWGATKSGRGHQKHATSSISFASYTLHTGESARDVKESGKEAGETRTESSEALQAVK